MQKPLAAAALGAAIQFAATASFAAGLMPWTDAVNATAARIALSSPDFVQQAKSTAELLSSDYNYPAGCKQGWLHGLDAEDCALGLRKVYDKLLDRSLYPNDKTVGLASLTIGGKFSSQSSPWGALEIEVPYDADPEDIARYINGTVYDPARLRQQREIAGLKAQHAKVQALFPFAITVDDSLTPEEFSQGLAALSENADVFKAVLAAYGPNSHGLDAIVIAPSSSSLYEENRELRLNLGYASTVADARQHLTKQASYLVAPPTVPADQAKSVSNGWRYWQAWLRDRSQMEALGKSLQAQYPDLEFMCGKDDQMIVAQCRQGLQVLADGLAIAPPAAQASIARAIVIPTPAFGTYAYAKRNDDGTADLLVSFTAHPSDVSAGLSKKLK